MADEDYESEGGSYTETSEKGWGERLGESIKGVAVGGILVIASIVLLFKNEGCAVKTAEGLKEVAGLVVTIQPDKVDSANEGKPVNVSGEAATTETLTDNLGFSANAFKISKNVEMYQWTESKKEKKEKKMGGKEQTTTTYDYKKEWSSSAYNSDNFNKEGKKRVEKKEGVSISNPAMAYTSGEPLYAKQATLGAFTLPESIIKRIGSETKVALTNEDLAKLSPEIKGKAKIKDGGLYIGKDPASPQVGDLKISFSKIEPKATITIRAKQTGSSFTPFTTKAGTTIEEVTMGIKTAQEMDQSAKDSNATMTWILRLVGFVAMAIGISMIFKPLETLGDVLPLLGDLLGLGINIFSGILAFVISFITIAIAWFFYRPILSLILIAIAVGAVFGFKYYKKMQAEKNPQPAKA